MVWDEISFAMPNLQHAVNEVRELIPHFITHVPVQTTVNGVDCDKLFLLNMCDPLINIHE